MFFELKNSLLLLYCFNINLNCKLQQVSLIAKLNKIYLIVLACFDPLLISRLVFASAMIASQSSPCSICSSSQLSLTALACHHEICGCVTFISSCELVKTTKFLTKIQQNFVRLSKMFTKNS